MDLIVETLKNMKPDPEDITRLFVERVNAGDAEGLAALYEPDAVIAFPPGQLTVGHDAILALYEELVAAGQRVEYEEPLTTLVAGDIALTDRGQERPAPRPGRPPPGRRLVAARARPSRLHQVTLRLLPGNSQHRGRYCSR